MEQGKDQREPGMPCPRCKFFIQMSIKDILYKTEFICPGCSLKLTLNRGESKDTLKALQQLHIALENLEAVKDKYKKED